MQLVSIGANLYEMSNSVVFFFFVFFFCCCFCFFSLSKKSIIYLSSAELA